MAGLSTIFSLILTRIATVSNSRSDEAMGQPPLIYEGPPSDTTTYHVGNRVILPCRAYGTTPIQYDWYQNGHLLETSLEPESNLFLLNGTLHVKTRSSQTDGYYQCFAINNYGVAMSNISHLQQAVFRDQPSSRRRVHTHHVSEGHSHVLHCRNVTSIPPATVQWFTMDAKTCDSHVQHPVNTSQRIAMDDSGGLVITTVSRADARDDLLYKCEAYNYVTRETFGSDCHRIQIKKESYDKDYAPELIYSSTKVTAQMGTTITLTCIFSGRPIPRMSWMRVRGEERALLPAPPSSELRDFGRRLVLSEVTLEDEGHYTCSATNYITNYISLSIVASPRLRVPLKNLNVTEGGSASFFCEADARPSPHVTWFVNAQPINSSSVRLFWKRERETLILFDLQLGDSSTVTCNVSNDFGYVLSSAYFTVLPSQATTASVFETSADTDQDAPVVMATVTSFNEYESTDDPYAYENSSPDENEEELFTTENDPSDYESRVVGERTWLNSSLVKCLWFSVPILLLIGFGFLVWQRYRNRKTTYRVEEKEKKHGSNNIDYDSEDSGYDEQKAERVVKKFKITEKEET